MRENTYQQNAVPPCEVGDRIELRRLGTAEGHELEGEIGTVTAVRKIARARIGTKWQIDAAMDVGRPFTVVWPVDTIRRLPA